MKLKEKLEVIRLLLGDPMDVLSSCLRAVIAAEKGKVLYNADFASIEVRVLFWIAGHKEGLKAYLEGRDLYKEMAAEVFGILVKNVNKFQRQVGKMLILGAGYGLGALKFREGCQRVGIEVTDALALKSITAYREVHKPVTVLWSNIEKAAISAVRNPGKMYTINKTSWWVEDRFLRCKLPSGRVNSYCDPQVKFEKKKWGGRMATLSYMGIDPYTKKWKRESTWGGKLVENIVQGIARDLLVDSHFRLEKAGYPLVLHVHDENLSEVKENFGSVKEYEELMAIVEPWAKGCPIAAEGSRTKRYAK